MKTKAFIHGKSALWRRFSCVVAFIALGLSSAPAHAQVPTCAETQCNAQNPACIKEWVEFALEKAKELQKELDDTHVQFNAATTRAREAIAVLERDARTLAATAGSSTASGSTASYENDCNDIAQDTDSAEKSVNWVEGWDQDIAKVCRASCASQDVFCIEATTGEPFCRNEHGFPYAELPRSVRMKTTLVVRVMGLDNTEGTIGISTNFFKSPDTPLPRKVTDSSARAASSRAPGSKDGPPNSRFIQLKDDHPIEVLGDDTLQSFAIVFQWKPAREDRRRPLQKSIEIAIDHGKYYYEVGLLVPFIVNGARTVTLTPLSATGGERRISVVEDSVVRPALALSLFPWGRRQARVSAWGPFRCGDLFGVQLGVDLDLGDPFNRIYVGGVLEPVAGLSVNLGLAMVKGQFVPSGYAAGTVLSVEDTFTPDTRYMPRLYLGATVTTDVLTTIKGAAAEVRTSAGR